MMGWWRNQGNTRDGVAGAGNDLVDLEAGQLSALTGFCALGHLDLQFFCIDQIFRGHAKSP